MYGPVYIFLNAEPPSWPNLETVQTLKTNPHFVKMSKKEDSTFKFPGSHLKKNPKMRVDSWESDSNSSDGSFSSVQTDLASKYLKVNIKGLKQDCKDNEDSIKELLTDIERAPPQLLDNVYDQLCRTLRNHCYPNDDVLEGTKASMFHSVLEIICDQVRLEFGLTSYKQMEIEGQTTVRLDRFQGQTLHGRADYSVIQTSDFAGEKVQAGSKSSVFYGKKPLLVVECKRYTALEGVKQCLLYLANVKKDDPKRKYCYGIVTNFEQWGLVLWSVGKGYQVAGSFPLIFKAMQDENDADERKKIWEAKYSKMVDVIYTVLKRELQAIKKQSDGSKRAHSARKSSSPKSPAKSAKRLKS